MKVLLLMLLSLSLAFGKISKVDYSQYDDIFLKYEKEYGVSHFLMKSIALTENAKFDKNAIMKNTNGTVDIGLMQINSAWIKWMPEAKITREKLRDPDFNIKIAYKIMANIIKEHGYSWDSVGRYHSATPKHKKRYLGKLKENVKYLSSLNKGAVSLPRERPLIERKKRLVIKDIVVLRDGF